MDAAKALTLAVLAAIVAAGLAPLAAAEIGSPGVPDVVYDAAAKAVTSGGRVAYLDTRDLSIINLDATGVLVLCDSALASHKTAAVDAARRTVAFTSVTFSNAGTWTVRSTCAADSPAYATFLVESRDHYDLVVSFPKRYSSTLAWSGGPEYMTILVLDRMAGRAPVADADIVLYKGTSAERVVRTDANGFWDTEEPLPGAGTFVIEAYKNTAGDPSYETFGRTTLTIQPRGLVATRVGEAPLAEYRTSVTFNVAPTTAAANLLARSDVANYTLQLARPDGTVSTLMATGAAKEGDLEVTKDGAVVVTTRWMAGNYLVTLRANAAGTVTGAAEWVQTWLVAADLASKHDLVANVQPKRVLAGEPTDFAITVAKDGQPFGADVYLLTHEETMHLHAGTLSLAAVPSERIVRASAAKDGVYALRFTPELARGPYFVHAREPETPRHDNAGGEPLVVVEAASVTFSPGRLAYGLQHNVPVQAHVVGPNGRALTGTLTVAMEPSSGAVSGVTALSVVNGQASFVAEPLTKGRILWDFAPQGTNLAPQRAAGVLFVERPNITLTPHAIPLGAETALKVAIRDLAGNPLVGLVVEVCGTPFAGCAPSATTDSTGVATVHGAPIIVGTLNVRVNGVDIGETIEATTRVSPNIVLGDPILETRRVTAGSAFTVRVPVTNKGEATGLATVVLNIDGVQAAQQTVEVPAGQTVTVLLSAAVDKVGTYTVGVAAGSAAKGGLSVSVLEGGVPEKPSIPGFELVAALVALAATSLAVAARRR